MHFTVAYHYHVTLRVTRFFAKLRTCLLNQIAKISKSNQYRIKLHEWDHVMFEIWIKSSMRFKWRLNRIAIWFCTSLVQCPASRLALCLIFYATCGYHGGYVATLCVVTCKVESRKLLLQLNCSFCQTVDDNVEVCMNGFVAKCSELSAILPLVVIFSRHNRIPVNKLIDWNWLMQCVSEITTSRDTIRQRTLRP